MTTLTLESAGRSVTLVPIQVRDRPLCVVGLDLLANAIKKAKKAIKAIGLDEDLVSERETDCAALYTLFTSKDAGIQAQLNLGIPAKYVPTLRAGLALEYDQCKALEETQGELRLDPEETSDRLNQVDALIAELDVAKLGRNAE